MKKQFLLLYLIFCITLSAQAGVKDKVVRTLPKMAEAGKTATQSILSKTKSVFDNFAVSTIAPYTLESPFYPPLLTWPTSMFISRPISVPDLPKPVTYPSSLQLYSIIQRRVDATYAKARLAVAESPYRPIMGEPITFNHKISAFPMRGKDVYPDKPFLHKPVIGPFLTEAYFLAESNRLLLKHLKEVEEFWPAFYGATERFYAEADETTERFHKETGGTDQSDEAKLLSWAYNQIPENTQNLLLGEIHGYREIPQFVIDLLEKIAENQPAGRKIFLFTEFLPNTNSRGHLLGGLLDCPYESYYSHVWRKARQAGIEVVGLEDKYIRSNPNTVKASFGNYTVKIPEWGTMAGMQKRNDTWAKLIKQYRDENPDALFIVYAGAGHLLYNYPFTLAKRFAKENTFFLNIIPDEVYEGGEIIYQTDPLEELNPNMSFPHLAIKWQSPDLVQLSGYDARVRLPIDIKAKREDMVNWGVSGLSITPLPGGSELP